MATRFMIIRFSLKVAPSKSKKTLSRNKPKNNFVIKWEQSYVRILVGESTKEGKNWRERDAAE